MRSRLLRCRRFHTVRPVVAGRDCRRRSDFLDRLAQCGETVLAVIVVHADVAGALSPDDLFFERIDHPLLDHLATVRIDRVRDVCIELRPAVVVLGRPIFFEHRAALVAVLGAKMILRTATRAAVGQLAAGHGHERTFGTLNDLQVADDEARIERDRTKGLKPIVRIIHELNANFGDFHGVLLFAFAPP